MKKWELQSNFQFSIFNFQSNELLGILLKNRGITEEKEVEAFLNPLIEDVTIENVGIDKTHVKKTIKRILTAIKKQEQIVVFGDYDVDGITGTAILWETLFHMKAKVMPYIPSRIEEGYGLSVKGIENVLETLPETKLIISVDNGIVANKAVDFANGKKLDVIITDHHVKSEVLPNAYAIVHTTKLCGAGVAYLLSHELRKLENNALALNDIDDIHLELATLGTVADLVPLTGANRAIVKHGLRRLCRTKRKGLLALFQEAACESSTIGVYQIGHVIAPRLNASGRLYSAMDSLRLLCTNDRERAYLLASKLGQTNTERQTIMRESSSHATEGIRNLPAVKKLLFVSHTAYPEGVIGLVAGRLVEEFYRPAIVISVGEEVSKGSARSISGFNMIDFLRDAADLMINVGGHPMAAGFSVETAKVPLLQARLEEAAEKIIDEAMLTKSLRIDCELPLEIVNKKLYDSIQSLAPFGMGNPEPTFVSRNVEIRDMKTLGKEGKHLRLMLTQDMVRPIEAIAFSIGERMHELKIGSKIDVVYTIDENNWQGNRKIQLKVKDFQLANIQ